MAYLIFHVSASFLKLCLYFFSLNSKPNVTSSNTASAPLTPAPTAVPVFDDEDDEDDDDDDNDDNDDGDDSDDDEEALVGNREVDAETGPAIVTVAVTVTEVVSVSLGDVEPEVRLKITSPASIKNGAVLPLVGSKHVLLFAKPGPQQNTGWSWK